MPPGEPVRTRDRLEEFMSLRRAARKQEQWLAKQGDGPAAGSAMHGDEDEEYGSGDGASSAQSAPVPPPWVRVLQSFADLEGTVGSKMDRLHVQQRDFFAPKFVSGDEEEEQQQDLEKGASEVQKLLKELERMVTIGVRPADPENVDEVSCAKNVQKHLSTRLNVHVNSFRDGQQLFMDQLKARDEKVKKFRQHGRAEVHQELEQEEKIASYMELGYSQVEIQELLQEEERQKEVSNEVQGILQSIEELQEMFRDLNALVVEQGSVLDRIDYNIQQTRTNMGKGLTELQKAREHQRRCTLM